MPKLPSLERVSDISLGKDPALEAWIYHFLIENNLEYLLNPSFVASPEQLRFMVALKDEQIYVPCSDAHFFLIYNKQNAKALLREYLQVWKFIAKLVHSYRLSRTDSMRLFSMCRHRFQLYASGRMILPSRMVKRILGIVLTQSGTSDPFHEHKRLSNAHAAEMLVNPYFQNILHTCPDFDLAMCQSVPHLRRMLDVTENARLAVLSTFEPLWGGNVNLSSLQQELSAYTQEAFNCFSRVLGQEAEERKKILFLPDVAGGFMLDIELLKSLVRQGHQVMLALKDAFYFYSPTILDTEGEPLLKQALEDAYFLNRTNVSKTELLRLLREHHFLVLSDGTSEQLNLYRTSVSFARAWKECDVVIAKGRRSMNVLLGTSHEFTRDILCYWRDKEDNRFHISVKPRAAWVYKFAEKAILSQARKIVREMQAAKEAGKTVMFYSAIIGSIPRQTKVAISLVNTFVAHLRNKLDNTLIINPAEHFEEGMDGDDLMFMWEYVQRSGLLDVWRFQTVEDIEASFALMNRKVPSIWSGKDSTFSTGCTKEMRIALDMQRQHPELQIIGPAADKFFRRRDYGIGKYFDASLEG